MEEKGIVFFGHKSDSINTVAGADKHNDRKPRPPKPKPSQPAKKRLNTATYSGKFLGSIKPIMIIRSPLSLPPL